MNKQYPLRSKGREFHLCTCSHGKDQHNISWFSKITINAIYVSVLIMKETQTQQDYI